MWATVSLVQVCWFAMVSLLAQTQPLSVQSIQLAAYVNQDPTPPVPTTRTDEPVGEPLAQPSDEETEGDVPVTTSDTTSSESSTTVDDPIAIPLDRLNHHIADPEEAKLLAQEQRKEATRDIDIKPLEQLIDRISQVERPRQIRLTLEDALRRAMESSYAIRVSSYNPAIEATRVVEAEAVFDAAFFTNISNNKVDQPSASALQGTNIQNFTATTGIRKLLPSGMQVEASYGTQRSSNDFQFQTLNPQWFDQFAVQFRQPLLRGFGVDFNRAEIHLRKLGRRQATQAFRRQVRDTLRQTEEAYWRLVQARRTLVISAKLLASFERIYNQLDARRVFDTYRIQLADTKARLESSKADFIQLVANVRNAEDHLIALMNDPTISLADDIEIIPVDVPTRMPVMLDRAGEVQNALDNRSEIVEAKLGIESARIQLGAAKNQTQPQLDVIFRLAVDGLGGSQHDAFDEVSKNDFTEYLFGLEFELPIGNRRSRAAMRGAELLYAQAIAALKQAYEQVILDVNLAVREVQVTFDQIEPNFQSAEASNDQVESIQLRAENQNFLTLNNELNARQALAQAQADLLRSMVDYGIALIDLERAKGTLLRYNNINLVFDDADDPAN